MATLPRSVARRACNMAAMMRHLGIWPDAAFTGLPMETAIGNCLGCREAGRCGRWLADPEADPLAWRRFCPNAELFARLRSGSIDELLDDPLVQLVVASDGVEREDLERLIDRLRLR